jgi:hypothetical protein
MAAILTLTNLLPQEWERIAQLRLSPLYVSVHATEPEVRSHLLKNPRAGQILASCNGFRNSGCRFMPRWWCAPASTMATSGTHPAGSGPFHQGDTPAVTSVAVVPVGLTRFRPADDELSARQPRQGRGRHYPGAGSAAGVSPTVWHSFCLAGR